MTAKRRARANVFVPERNVPACGHESRTKMAVQFGMDTKKLRMLEKGQCLPDSEILWQFYSDFRVPPSILLKDRNGLLNEAGWLLERIESESKNDIAAIVKAFQKKD